MHTKQATRWPKANGKARTSAPGMFTSVLRCINNLGQSSVAAVSMSHRINPSFSFLVFLQPGGGPQWNAIDCFQTSHNARSGAPDVLARRHLRCQGLAFWTGRLSTGRLVGGYVFAKSQLVGYLLQCGEVTQQRTQPAVRGEGCCA